MRSNRKGIWGNCNGSPGVIAGICCMAAVGTLGCADIDGNEAERLDQDQDAAMSEETASVEQEYVLKNSYPDLVTSPWYAVVKDTFFVELPNWRIHNNGCWFSCEVALAAKVKHFLGGQEMTNEFTYLVGEKYYGPDARDYDWKSPGVAFSVERRENGCFMLDLWATNIPNGVFAKPKYCWKSGVMNWVPESGGAQPIGTLQSIYQKQSTDFDVTFRFRLNWQSTTVAGSVLPKIDGTGDHDDWHHLPVTLWNSPKSVSVHVENLTGDTDLYTSQYERPPTETTYTCSSWRALKNPEDCTATGMTKLWASVRNWDSGPANNKFNLTVTPTY